MGRAEGEKDKGRRRARRERCGEGGREGGKKRGRENLRVLRCIICMILLLHIGSSESVSGSDNRDITDDGASQELTEENITEMKGQGASGKVICTSIIRINEHARYMYMYV